MHRSPHHRNPPPPSQRNGAAGEQQHPPNSKIFLFQNSNGGKVIKTARHDWRPFRSSPPALLLSARPWRCCCWPPVTPAVFVMPATLRALNIAAGVHNRDGTAARVDATLLLYAFAYSTDEYCPPYTSLHRPGDKNVLYVWRRERAGRDKNRTLFLG